MIAKQGGVKRRSTAWKTAIAEYWGQISAATFLTNVGCARKTLRQLAESTVSSVLLPQRPAESR